jgi:hypothetical protein
VNWRAAPAWLLTVAALLLAGPAMAQQRTPTPSADELWNEYPLDRGSPTAPTPAATAAAVRRHSAASGSGGTHAATFLLLAANAIALLALGAFLLRGRGRVRRARRDRASAQLRPPPAPDRVWVAEVEWRPAGDEARFCVVARDHPCAGGTVLAESAPVDWPPSGPGAVPALSAAAERLAATFTNAGWTPLPSDDAWYAKRFAWEPANQPPRPERREAGRATAEHAS